MTIVATSQVAGQPAEQINGAAVAPTVPSQEQVPAEATAPVTDAMSPKLVELARKQKAQRQYQLKLQSERQAFERQQQDFQARQKEYETNYVPKDRIRTDLIGVLSEAGLDMQQIMNLVQNPAVSMDLELKALKKEIAELKSYRDESTKAQEQNQGAQYQQAVNQIRLDVKSIVASDPRFETIKELDQTEAVVELIKQTFESGMGEKYPKGFVLSNEDAASLVEEQLIEDALKMAGLNKVKLKQTADTQAVAAPQVPNNAGHTVTKITPTSTKTPYSIKTLTNTMQGNAQRNPSWAEKRARAIARLEGRET